MTPETLTLVFHAIGAVLVALNGAVLFCFIIGALAWGGEWSRGGVTGAWAMAFLMLGIYLLGWI